MKRKEILKQVKDNLETKLKEKVELVEIGDEEVEVTIDGMTWLETITEQHILNNGINGVAKDIEEEFWFQYSKNEATIRLEHLIKYIKENYKGIFTKESAQEVINKWQEGYTQGGFMHDPEGHCREAFNFMKTELLDNEVDKIDITWANIYVDENFHRF